MEYNRLFLYTLKFLIRIVPKTKGINILHKYTNYIMLCYIITLMNTIVIIYFRTQKLMF